MGLIAGANEGGVRVARRAGDGKGRAEPEGDRQRDQKNKNLPHLCLPS